jgi:hypothetical protein
MKKADKKEAVRRVNELLKCRQGVQGCKYFIKTYIKLKDIDDEDFDLYVFQDKFIVVFLKHHRVVVLGSRQTGKTRIVEAICVWLLVCFPGYRILHVNRQIPQACTNIREIKEMIDSLPRWMRPGYKKCIETQFILGNGSEIWCEAGGIQTAKSGAGSPGAGRGRRAYFIWIDEAAYVNLSRLDTSVIPSTSKTFLLAEKKGIPYGIVYSSTPNGIVGVGKDFYIKWTHAVNDQSIFKSVRMYWKDVPDYDSAWFEVKCAELNYDWRKINQEYELKFLGSETSFLSDKILEGMESSTPIEIEHKTGGDLWIFSHAEEGKKYLIGIDTATMYGADYSAVEVFDYESMEQVAEYKGKLQITTFCTEIIKGIISRYRNCVIVPESNSVGQQVVEYFYNNDPDRLLVDPESIRAKHKQIKYGFTNTSKTRPLLFNSLYAYMKDYPESVKSERLILELTGLERRANGRVEAMEGINDDLALAMGFVAYTRDFIPEVVEYFGQDEITITGDEIIVEGVRDLGRLGASMGVNLQGLSESEIDQFIKKHLMREFWLKGKSSSDKSVDVFEIMGIGGDN